MHIDLALVKLALQNRDVPVEDTTVSKADSLVAEEAVLYSRGIGSVTDIGQLLRDDLVEFLPIIGRCLFKYISIEQASI